MTTFDIAEVLNFTADIDARLKQCDNGEGMDCWSLDGSLRFYATLCREFRAGVRAWGRAVFGGYVEFDPEVEKIVLRDCKRLLALATAKAAHAEAMEFGCYTLDGRTTLQSALWDLSRLMNGWVTPGLSVSPGPRVRLHHTPEQLEAIRLRLAAMPSLPADWLPDDPVQRREFQRILDQCGFVTATVSEPALVEEKPANDRAQPDPAQCGPHSTRQPGVRDRIVVALRGPVRRPDVAD